MRYIPDQTGRFRQRPFFDSRELDIEFEQVITAFVRERHGVVQYPIETEDLTVLMERYTDDLDLYGDLSEHGRDVQGVTEFFADRKPRVSIASDLSSSGRENRLRTTLTHEFGHVRLHSPLYQLEARTPRLFREEGPADRVICKRDSILDAPQRDWMEWQAGYVCGAVLMPLSEVTRLVTQYREQSGNMSLISAGSRDARALCDCLTGHFRVSQDAAAVRLTKLGYLKAGTSRQLLFD